MRVTPEGLDSRYLFWLMFSPETKNCMHSVRLNLDWSEERLRNQSIPNRQGDQLSLNS